MNLMNNAPGGKPLAGAVIRLVSAADKLISMAPGLEPRLLNPDQAAVLLGLGSRWAVYRLVKSGEIPAVRIAGKLRLDREDIDRMIEAKKGGQAAPPAGGIVHPAGMARPRATLTPLRSRSPGW
jgi:excisionase family DNA binding protein